MLGAGEAQIVACLERNGLGASRCRAEIERIEAEPALGAGERIAQRLKKLESVLALQQALSELSFGSQVVERRSHVSPEEFRERYYCANRPVVLTGLFDQSPALRSWSPAYFRERCGDATVEIMAGRDGDRDYEINCESHRTTMALRDFVDLVVDGPATNDRYLVANNGFFDRPETEALRRDLHPMLSVLDPDDVAGKVFLWFGPGGTITPLHHDVMNVLFAQVRGHKTFSLIPPTQIPDLYNHVGVYSAVDFDAPDLDRFPRFRRVKPLTVSLSPGELLFIPVGWFHHVRAEDVSIGISFTNFIYPNAYEWSHPTARA